MARITDPEKLKELAEKLTPIACQQLQIGIDYRQPKIDQILKAEELYFNRTQKTLKGRFNIPLPIVSGFVDTLLSKIDDEITINYDPTEIADTNKVRKVSAAWLYDSAPTRGMWSIKDLLVKKLAIFSGRGIYKIFSESDPVYKNHLAPVDAFDFIAEPNGGWHLENHLFCGQENIFHTKDEMTSGPYDQDQVTKLVTFSTSNEYKTDQSKYLNRQKRLATVGLDTNPANYVGTEIFSLVEYNMYWEGWRYYLVFDPQAKTWVRIADLADITGEPEENELPAFMFRSWATHPDYWNFWSKAPVDDVVPVAVGLKQVANFMFDDFQKKLWGQRIFDAEVIQDPSQLEWDRPDKLISAVLPAGKTLQGSVYEFQTGDNSSITINLLDYMRNFISLESGVTAGEKGNTDDKLLGIAKINEGNVADRLGLTNKNYVQCDAELGLSYLRGLKMCMTTKMLIRMIGENGAESAELTKDDLNFSAEPDIRITGGKTEFIKNEEKKQAKQQGLIAAINVAPDLINKKIAAESLLANTQWSPDEITALMDVDSDGDEDESIRASQAIQDILNGKEPKLYIGATTRFMKKIYDYGTKKVLDKPALNAKLMKYALAHKQIVIENMARKAMIANMTRLAAQPQSGAAPAGQTPVAGSDPQVVAPQEKTNAVAPQQV